MQLILGLLIGFFIGIGLGYIAQQQKIKQINQKLQQARRVLKDKELANREHNAQIEGLKLDREKLHQLQADQQLFKQQLEASRQQELDQMRVSFENNLQKQGDLYQNQITALQSQRQQDDVTLKQAKQEIETLNQLLEQHNSVPTTEADFVDAYDLSDPEAASEEDLDSLFDLFSDPVTDPEPLTHAEPDITAIEEIQAIAESNQSRVIPQLSEYSNHPDPETRLSATETLSNIAKTNQQKGIISTLTQSLGKFSQDLDPNVRKSAVTGLSNISSTQVIPWLKSAQRDSDSDIVKIASQALNHFKGQRLRIRTEGKSLPKNARLIDSKD